MDSLDLSPKEFRSILYKVSDIIIDLYSNLKTKKVYHAKHPLEIRALFDEALPENGQNLTDLIYRINKQVFNNVTLHYSPNFYAWVTSNASQAGIVGEILSTAINVNATTWMNAAAASEIEKKTTLWIAEFIGYPSNGGVFLSGGSTANLTGLSVARNKQYEKLKIDYSDKRLVYYTSEQAHFSIDKSLKLLGFSQDNLTKIAVDDFYRIDTKKLRDQIKNDLSNELIPCCIIGNAGTVNTGAIDNLEELAAISKEFNIWYHIDAAYGGFAAATEYYKKAFKGIEYADSLALDLHKWLYVPFEAGCLLLNDKENLRRTFSLVPEYQSFDDLEDVIDYSEYSFQQSRNFKALKAWLTFSAYGAQGLKENIGKSIINMRYLAKLISDADDFVLSAPQSLSVVCFQYTSKESQITSNSNLVNKLNRLIIQKLESETRIFIRPTTLNEKIVFRACCTNFRRDKKDINRLVQILREIGEAQVKQLLMQ